MITAVDVGATKTLIAQFKDASGPINQIRFETPSIAADFVRTLNRQLSALKDITALAIGLPGQISDDGETVLYCGNLPWRNVPLKKMLAAEHHCPIYLENDAAMGGLGEMNAILPIPRLGFYLSLGTGVGGAIIVRGKLVDGLNRSEVGHMMLRGEDATWNEWEDIASGRAIVAKFHKLAKDLDKPEEWQWLAENIVEGLSPIIATILPDTIVVGGGVGHYFEAFHGLVAEKLHRRLPKYITIPKMSSAKHADQAVLFGCYYHATHKQAV
jgi:glucokinase